MLHKSDLQNFTFRLNKEARWKLYKISHFAWIKKPGENYTKFHISRE